MENKLAPQALKMLYGTSEYMYVVKSRYKLFVHHVMVRSIPVCLLSPLRSRWLWYPTGESRSDWTSECARSKLKKKWRFLQLKSRWSSTRHRTLSMHQSCNDTNIARPISCKNSRMLLKDPWRDKFLNFISPIMYGIKLQKLVKNNKVHRYSELPNKRVGTAIRNWYFV